MIEVVRSSSYQGYICCGSNVVAFVGSRIALVVDVGTASAEVQVERMAGEWLTATDRVVAIMEQTLTMYEAITGFSPALTAPFLGRMRVEVAHIDAAGLAHHGRLGFAMGPGFLKSMMEGVLSGKPNIHHVVGYEMLRNFIDPNSFTTCFDYCCCEGKCGSPSKHFDICRTNNDSWGWVNQGFVDVVGCLVSDQLVCDGSPVAFDYFGHDRRGFRGQMEAHLTKYNAGTGAGAGSAGAPPLPWEAVFLHDRLPWDAGSSLDNVYAGVLSQLYERYGGPALLGGMFRAIPLLLSNGRAPSSKADWRTAAENFALAASLGAGCDLAPYFASLRWPLRPGVLGPGGLAEALLAAYGDGVPQ